MSTLFLLLELEDLLAELDQLRLLAVLHDHLELLLRVLLEGVPVEERVARLACAIVLPVGEPVHATCVSFHAARLDARLSLAELKLAIGDPVRGERLRRVRLLVQVDHLVLAGARLRRLNGQDLVEHDLLLALATTLEVLL